MIASLVRLFALGACVVIGASFVLFAWDEAGTASSQREGVARGETERSVPHDADGRELGRGPTRRRIDSISDALTNPVNNLAEGNRWTRRAVPLIVGWLFYGLGGLTLARALGRRW